MVAAVLGYITCPSCGQEKAMRITHDKNGHPFGFCEAECSQQLRIGGDARRVSLFIARYPWAAGKSQEPQSQQVEKNEVSEVPEHLRILGIK